jgi:hypothetical protein
VNLIGNRLRTINARRILGEFVEPGSQKAETKRLSEQTAALTEKLDAFQRSVADIPAPSLAVPDPLQKAQPSKR